MGWLGTLAVAGVAAPLAVGQEAEKKVSGVFGVDFNTHFISYGLDVWTAGNDWSEGTINPYAELSFNVEDTFSVTFGTWWDVNDNADSSIGGDLQEVDVYAGIGFDIDKFSLGATYQEWYYGGGVERVVDLSVGYDDTGMIADDFALNPYVLIHIRPDDEDLGLEEGAVFVVGIEPSFNLVDSEDFVLDLSVPVAAGFATDDFHGGDGGFAYVSVGGFVSVPLTFIPAEYGDWALGAGLTYYHTSEDVIPSNPDENFVTGTVGVSLAF
jgi:hypothetical protein